MNLLKEFLAVSQLGQKERVLRPLIFSAPSHFLSTIIISNVLHLYFNLEQKSYKTKGTRNANNRIWLMQSVECCCVALFQEPIKWLVFDIQTHALFCMQISFILQCFENLFSGFTKYGIFNNCFIIGVSNFMNINYMLQGQGRVKLFYEVAQIKNSVAQN